MMELLHFVFSSFWVWAGTVVLLALLVNGTVGLLSVLIGRRR